MRHAVILMSYNRPRYVIEAMQSVLTQEGDVHLYVSDDGSSDETLHAIRQVAEQHDNVTLLMLGEVPTHRQNGGERSCARIDAAIDALHPTIDLVHYLPDDDVFMPQRFLAFDHAFEQDSSAEWFYGRIVPMAADGRLLPDSTFAFDPFPGVPIPDPDCRIDCTQIAHRRRCLDLASWKLPVNHEGHFFTQLALFFGPALPLPLDQIVSAHRYHDYNLLTVQERAGELPRE